MEGGWVGGRGRGAGRWEGQVSVWVGGRGRRGE